MEYEEELKDADKAIKTLGGSFGIGTIISSVLGGVFVQMVFNMYSFDVKNLKHENIFETMKRLEKVK